MGRRTFSKMRKHRRRTRRGGDPVKGNAASLITATVPKSVTDNLPQNVVAGDCAAIKAKAMAVKESAGAAMMDLVKEAATYAFLAKAKKCQDANAAQAKDLMAAAAEKAKVAQAASTVATAASAVQQTAKTPAYTDAMAKALVDHALNAPTPVVAATKAVGKTVSAGPKLRKLSDAEKRACVGQVKAGFYKDQAACELMKARTAKVKGGKGKKKKTRRRSTRKGMRRKTARRAYTKKR